ncbi:MAG: acylphosphatase, partial [Chloroflexales bacterium]|nr:acylphosphatase [Chloroflexales bacterium]
MEQRRLKIEIHGAVQGVGFRPFVYRLATDLALGGWVINDTEGVFIEVEGPDTTLRSFLERIPAEKPPRAIIHSLESSWIATCGEQQFSIRHSATRGAKTVLALPEIATCADCLAEIGDPANRRYRYPFTNCTNCGPRFTIIEALPYDRPNTTMRQFAFCADCAAEYVDPRDRRFHAQPNACPVCGPQLELWERIVDRESTQGDVAVVPGHRVIARRDEALQRAAAALRAGQIVAVKGLGGFHL